MNYHRPFSHGMGRQSSVFPPVIKWLLIINVAAFLGPRVLNFNLDFFYRAFGLVPAYVLGKFFVWQPVTYMFLHADTWHILMNMFILWMFGSELERTWGSREFLKFYFVAGVGAGIFNFFFAVFNPATNLMPIIGASGAIYGILVAYAMLFPERYVYIYFLIPVKVKFLVIFLVIIAFLSTYRPDGIAHFAHLGGALVGFLYLKFDWRWKLRKWFPGEIIRRVKIAQSAKKVQEETRMMEEVDVILDKISRVGYENLTRGEKKILEKASDKLSEHGQK